MSAVTIIHVTYKNTYLGTYAKGSPTFGQSSASTDRGLNSPLACCVTNKTLDFQDHQLERRVDLEGELLIPATVRSPGIDRFKAIGPVVTVQSVGARASSLLSMR